MVQLCALDVKLLNQSFPTCFTLSFPYDSLAYKPSFHAQLEYTVPWMPVVKSDFSPIFHFLSFPSVLVFSRHFISFLFFFHFLSTFIHPAFQEKPDGVSAIRLYKLHCHGRSESQRRTGEVAVMDNRAASTKSGSCSFVRGLV